MSGGNSLRRLALDLAVDRKTVIRKFEFLGLHSTHFSDEANKTYPKAEEMQFDDMETFEHSKCKPLSITLAVVGKQRRILGFEVSQMPAKGMLAKISRKKYGRRSDERPEGRRRLFTKVKDLISDNCIIKSDMNPHYTKDVERHFPGHVHKAFKGRRGCVVGQGELKRGGFDPLFTLNHNCAMLRENLNRLRRKTWSTTKKPERLRLHLAIFTLYYNEFYLKKRKCLHNAAFNQFLSRQSNTSLITR